MFRFRVTPKVTMDRTAAVLGSFKDLQKMKVYVGIPEAKSARKDPGITNAQLAFLHTHGTRQVSMRLEMLRTQLKKKVTYSAAHGMYILAHGSALYHVPPRPIIEPALMAAGNREPIEQELKLAASALLAGDKPTALAHMNRAGMMGQNSARSWFHDPRNNWPPNAPSTIKAKGSDKVLIHTAQMLRAITYVLKR